MRRALMMLLFLPGIALATRQAITPTDLPGLFTTAGTDITLNAADVSNSDRVTMTGAGRDILCAFNSHASNTYNVTVTSVSDTHGRSGDINNEAVPAGHIHVFGPFSLEGWRQSSDSSVYFNASNASIKWFVLRLK